MTGCVSELRTLSDTCRDLTCCRSHKHCLLTVSQLRVLLAALAGAVYPPPDALSANLVLLPTVLLPAFLSAVLGWPRDVDVMILLNGTGPYFDDSTLIIIDSVMQGLGFSDKLQGLVYKAIVEGLLRESYTGRPGRHTPKQLRVVSVKLEHQDQTSSTCTPA